jgi:hypothetical protein
MMLRLRPQVSADQQRMFPHNALTAPASKASVVAVQGFGRFGPFGPGHTNSKVRYDLRQDAGAAVWLPWVVGGGVWAWQLGRRQLSLGCPPTAWAALLYASVALGVVTSYIPMAWDRYLLSIQAPAALLAAGAAVALLRRWGGTQREAQACAA